MTESLCNRQRSKLIQGLSKPAMNADYAIQYNIFICPVGLHFSFHLHRITHHVNNETAQKNQTKSKLIPVR